MRFLTHIYQSWVKRVTQSIANQIECQYREHDHNTWHKDEVRSIKNTVTFLAQHQSPLRCWRCCTKPKEGKSRGIENRRCDYQSCLDDQGCDRVWENVTS